MKITPLTKYLTFQLYTAIQYAPKITKKSDIENLHKFRVAIRRSRSLLKLFMPDAYAIGAVLKEIVQKTNELRELDVFLRSLDSYTYPKLTKKINKYREQRFDTVLTAAFIHDSLSAINKLYDELFEINVLHSNNELIKTTEEHYAKSLKIFRNLTSNESDEALHELRIRFKMSRYALDFLSESGLHNEHKKIKECKRIQDHFGDIQDTANQLQWLKHFCKENPCNECKQLIKERKKSLKLLKKYM